MAAPYIQSYRLFCRYFEVPLSTVIGKHWNGVDSDIAWIRSACHWLDGILKALANLSEDAEHAVAYKQRIAQFVVEQNESLECNAPTRGMSVHYHPIDSIYKEGQNRINRGEAEAIVEDIVTKLRQPKFNKSIGIVTFNTEQQKLIADLFEAARSQYPEIEPHFSEDKFDSVFVKNLESVQGDERDLIYFSITFGKDAAGKLSMNFGPMNQAGGTRRLNVAVTRAKEEMHIFACLKPEQIDLSRTRAEGIRDLKHFLEYAQRGVSALTEAVGAPGGFFDSPFEQAVAEKLHLKGWVTHSQVGVSGFRIDLGVINPVRLANI